MRTKGPMSPGSGPRSSERCAGGGYTPGCRPHPSAIMNTSRISRRTKCEYNNLDDGTMQMAHQRACAAAAILNPGHELTHRECVEGTSQAGHSMNEEPPRIPRHFSIHL